MPPFLLGILLDWRTWAFVAVIGVATWLHHDGVMSERHKWEAAMAAQKAEAAELLATATARAQAVDDHNRKLASQLEIDNENLRTHSDRLLVNNRALALQLGGLRDPGRRADSGCAVSSAAGTAAVDPRADPGLLSAEATEFLLEFARAADDTRDRLRTCQAWVKGIGVAGEQ